MKLQTDPVEIRVYDPAAIAGFLHNSDWAGPLSNMFPLPARVGDVEFDSAEALYQALRFPDLPAHQEAIRAAPDAFTAKRVAYQRIDAQRRDWKTPIAGHPHVSAGAMRLALRAKLAHPAGRAQLLALLAETGDRPLVEISPDDGIWGAIPQADGTLVGSNFVGRIWMEIRRHLAQDPDYPAGCTLAKIPDLLLFGQEVPYPYEFGLPTPAPALT